jgi:hypothetical protein
MHLHSTSRIAATSALVGMTALWLALAAARRGGLITAFSL